MLLTTLRLDLSLTRPYLGRFQQDLACWNAIEALYPVGNMEWSCVALLAYISAYRGEVVKFFELTREISGARQSRFALKQVHAIFHGSKFGQKLDKKKENCLNYSGWDHLRPIFYVLSEFHVHLSSWIFTFTFCWVKLEKKTWEMVTNCPQIA